MYGVNLNQENIFDLKRTCYLHDVEVGHNAGREQYMEQRVFHLHQPNYVM